jgi:hypothetical protein
VPEFVRWNEEEAITYDTLRMRIAVDFHTVGISEHNFDLRFSWR